MRGVLIVLVLVQTAHADEPTELHEEAPHEGLTRDATGPLLHLEPLLRPNVESFVTDRESHTASFDLGPIARANIEASAWRGELFGATGWSGTIRVAHDFKWFQVGFEASINRVDSGTTHGSYRLLGLSIMRTKKLSRWMTAWISLTIGKRTWEGQPPRGETNDTAVMLSIGTTFR